LVLQGHAAALAAAQLVQRGQAAQAQLLSAVQEITAQRLALPKVLPVQPVQIALEAIPILVPTAIRAGLLVPVPAQAQT
jgi:hypothetical protein